MQTRHIILRVVMAMMVIALTAMLTYKALAPLPAPIPPHGQIVDAATGKPVVGAQIKTSWQLYDYPMLDGAGSYELSSVTQTDAKGEFSLAIPDHRRGLWNTEVHPTTITAAGYKPFRFDDARDITYAKDGDFVVIKLTPK